MHILHISDQAGVACILAKYQRLQGHEAKVIRVADQDKYGIISYYRDCVVSLSEKEFYVKCIDEAEHADIIHIHGAINLLFQLRKKYGRSKKIILHYHGSDIRMQYPMHSNISSTNSVILPKHSLLYIVLKRLISRIKHNTMPKQLIHVYAQKLADLVLVSTPDLLCLTDNATYLPNPIDTDLFRDDIILSESKKKAFTIETEITNASQSIRYCRDNDIDLEIEVYNRSKKPVKYEEMPSLLKNFGIYIDIKHVNSSILRALSKTGLEALACGLKVLDHQLEFHEGLPTANEPKRIVSYLSTIYSWKSNFHLSWYLLFLLRVS
ncbi:MAG: hypothetical protein WA364_07295 [Candidatus Nitrosopolaris sp.]